MLKQPVAVEFPGQGSQKTGMSDHLLELDPKLYSLWMEKSSAILGWDVGKMCSRGDASDLRRTSITQPTIFIVNLITWQLLHQAGLRPSLVAGHSLGEYSALVVAGVLNFEDALSLVAERGRLMEMEAPRNAGMVAVIGVGVEEVNDLCGRLRARGDYVDVANDNGRDQVVVSGYADGLVKLKEKLADFGARCIDLNVSGPFHSSLMGQAKNEFTRIVDDTNFCNPKIPLISNVTGVSVGSAKHIKELITRQMVERVRWRESLCEMRRLNIKTHIECGPGRVLTSLTRRELGASVDVLSTDSNVSILKVLRCIREA